MNTPAEKKHTATAATAECRVIVKSVEMDWYIYVLMLSIIVVWVVTPLK